MAGTSDEELLEELKHAYCNFCQSRELRITRTITVTCKKCGKTRVIQAKLAAGKK